MAKKHKRLLIWIGSIVAAVVCIIVLQHPMHENDIEKYLQGHGNFDTMAQNIFPAAETFSQVKDILYEYLKEGYWSTKVNFEGAVLELSYDPLNYEKKKSELDTAYIYYTNSFGSSSNYNIIAFSTNESAFMLNGYYFRVIDWSKSPEYDENYIALVAYNDEKHSVCYLFFYEQEVGHFMQIDLQIKSIPINGPWKENNTGEDNR